MYRSAGTYTCDRCNATAIHVSIEVSRHPRLPWRYRLSGDLCDTCWQTERSFMLHEAEQRVLQLEDELDALRRRRSFCEKVRQWFCR